jgi:polyferredoxin
MRDGVTASLDDFEAPTWVERIAREVPTSFTALVRELAIAPIPARPDKLAAYCQAVVTDLVDRDILRHVLRPRTLVYAAILVAIVSAFIAMLYLRVPLKVDVIRDRTALVRELSDGRLENVYRLQIMNTTEDARQFTVTASGIEGLELVAVQPVTVAAAHAVTLPVALRVDPGKTTAGSHPVQFHVTDTANASVKADEKSIFYAGRNTR